MSVSRPRPVPVPASGRSVGRYGQLTFTSFDGLGGAGWQVKDSRGLSPDEIDVLRAGIDARLDAGMELARFPSPTDLEAFPRRLVFEAGPPRGQADPEAAWWHHAPAGSDGSGRPGNVFVHVLLDRGGSPTDRVRRPIDLWRSPQWLTPFGPEAVRNSALPSREPGPGPAITTDRVIAFLLDFGDYRRLSVLRVLLDACAAAMNGGPPVVLTAADTDTAALWIAAVSYLTSPATARCLSFSTLERPASLPNRFHQRIRLCCTPRQDHDRLRDRNRGYVLLADDRDVRTGDLGGEPHVTAAGDRVRVTEWSVLAKVALVDDDLAARALAEITRIAGAAPAVPGHPAWPLAMAVAMDAHRFSDGVQTAQRVLPNTPDGASPEQLALARSLVARPELAVDEAWELVQAAIHPGQPLGAMAEQVLGIYVTLAARDLDRLARPGGPALPEAEWRTRTWVTDAVTAAIEATLDDLRDSEDERVPSAVLGLATLTWRLGLLDRFGERLTDEVERSVTPGLTESGGPEFVASVGHVAEPVLAAVVRRSVTCAIAARAPGRGLSPEVLAWLYPDGPPLEPAGADDRLRVELAVQSVLADSERHRDQRPLALSGSLWFWQQHSAGPGPAELSDLYGEPPWLPAELLGVDEHVRGLVPATLVGPAVKAGPPGAALDRLIETIEWRSGPAYLERFGTGDLAELRRLSQRKWWLDGQLGSGLDRVLAGGIAGLAYPQVGLDPDAAETLQIGMLLALALDVYVDDVERLVEQRASPPGARSSVLHALADSVGRGVSVAQLAVGAMRGDPRFPAPRLQGPAFAWAAGLTVQTVEGPVPLLRRCVALAADRHRIVLDGLHPAVRTRIWELLTAAGNSAPQAYTATDRFAHSWLKSVVSGDGWFSRWR